MRTAIASCTVLLLAACAKVDDTAQVREPNEPAVVPVSLSALAGRWRMRAFNSAGDSLVGYELNATGDTAGWTIVFPGRDPIPTRVAVLRSRIIIEAGPYQSVLRPGVEVRTQGTLQLQGDSLVGNTIARYGTTSSDSLLRVRVVGRRVP